MECVCWQAIPRLLVLSLIGYLASVASGTLAYVLLTIDLRHLVVSENETEFFLDDIENIDTREESDEYSGQWLALLKFLTLLFQTGSFLIASLLLLKHFLQ